MNMGLCRPDCFPCTECVILSSCPFYIEKADAGVSSGGGGSGGGGCWGKVVVRRRLRRGNSLVAARSLKTAACETANKVSGVDLLQPSNDWFFFLF